MGVTDRKLRRILQRRLDVLVAEVEVATERQSRMATIVSGDLVEQLLEIHAVVEVHLIGVRSRDGMFNTVIPCHGAHVQTDLVSARPIVNVGQDMTMNVDHLVASNRYQLNRNADYRLLTCKIRS